MSGQVAKKRKRPQAHGGLKRVLRDKEQEDNSDFEHEFDLDEDAELLLKKSTGQLNEGKLGWELRSDDGDSDREYQIAFRDGLIKSDRLNYEAVLKRPVINKTDDLTRVASELDKKLDWLETLDVQGDATMTDAMLTDDFQRELHIFKQAETAAREGVRRLLAQNVPVFRPADYYAEMAKSDEHMHKVRKRLNDLKLAKARQEQIRRVREEKKYALKVGREVKAARSEEHKKLNEAVKSHRKGMKTQLEAMLNNAQDDEPKKKSTRFEGGRGDGNNKRKISRKGRDAKFGFGGKKRGSKRNDAASFAEGFGGGGKRAAAAGGGRKNQKKGGGRR